ncbi:MAG TPA: J domain-containing protein [Caulobacteraceae bacterium]
MKAAFQYRPRFVDIRVRPPKPQDEPDAAALDLKPGERLCDHLGCRAAGVTRAPKSRALLGEHYWFCQAHAAEYNRTWNFFAGMSEGEMRAKMADELATGGRPTWSFKAGARNREAAASRGFFRDPFGIFGPAKARADDERAAFDRRLGRLERAALADLDLDATADSPAIRIRYIELVKRCHPDANGGDRSAEHKLQRVIRAYKTLRRAKLV